MTQLSKALSQTWLSRFVSGENLKLPVTPIGALTSGPLVSEHMQKCKDTV